MSLPGQLQRLRDVFDVALERYERSKPFDMNARHPPDCECGVCMLVLAAGEFVTFVDGYDENERLDSQGSRPRKRR